MRARHVRRVVHPVIGLVIIGVLASVAVGVFRNPVASALSPTVADVVTGAATSSRSFKGTGSTSTSTSRSWIFDDSGAAASRSEDRSESTAVTGTWGGIEKISVPYSRSTSQKDAAKDLQSTKATYEKLLSSSEGTVADESTRTTLKTALDRVDALTSTETMTADAMNDLRDEIIADASAVTQSEAQWAAAQIAAQEKAGAAAKAASSGSSTGSVDLTALMGASKAVDLSSIKDPTGDTGDDVVSYALQYVGLSPYVWAGSTPDGWDCSGFVMYVYAKFGVSLPHYSGSQAKMGTAVDSLSDAKPGDVIANSMHAAIYIGGGYVVNALNPTAGTTVTPVQWAFSGSYSIRRML